VLAALGFPLFGAADRTQGVDGSDSADRAGGKASLEHFAIGADREVGRVNDAAPFFPVGAYSIGIFGYFKAVADRKVCAGFCDHLLGLFERIDGQRHDICVLGFEFFVVSLVIGNLPNAIRSPNAAIVNNDGVLAFESRGQLQCPTIGQIYIENWERIARI
jgi:hypothetical protein